MRKKSPDNNPSVATALEVTVTHSRLAWLQSRERHLSGQTQVRLSNVGLCCFRAYNNVTAIGEEKRTTDLVT